MIGTLHAYGAFAATVFDAFPPTGRRLVRWASPDQLAAGLGEVEALLGVAFPALDWSAATRLRLVHLAGSGTDRFLPAPGLPGSVVVANARGLSAAAMAEFALAAVLALAKRLPRAYGNQLARRWQATPPVVLAGGRAVVLGAGPVGRAVGRLLRAVGLSVVGVRRTAEACAEFDRTVTVDRLDAELAQAQVLVVAAPLTSDTRGLLDEARLRRCPPGTLLVNVSRGGIVDEEAVASLLHSGHLGGAALDTFAHEPLPVSSPLWSAPDALLTPHVSWTTPGYERAVAELFLANVERIERGEPVVNQVDVGLGYGRS